MHSMMAAISCSSRSMPCVDGMNCETTSASASLRDVILAGEQRLAPGAADHAFDVGAGQMSSLRNRRDVLGRDASIPSSSARIVNI